MHYVLPRHSLLTIYKSFIRPHLDYGDIIYDQPNNQAFSNKLEVVQYNAALAITGTIRGTSKTKVYQELGLESLKSHRWFRRLCYLYKIKNYGLPEYLFKLIPVDTHSYNTRISENITTYHCRTDTFKHLFFLWTIVEWKKLDLKGCKSTYNLFRNQLLKSIQPLSNLTYNILDLLGICLLTRLRFGLSHLNKHRSEIFSSIMVKNNIWLGGASKQNAPFLKTFAPKNAPMPLMSRIGPAGSITILITV